MRVAVTGASGFIGQHVVKALATHNLDVYAFSRSNISASKRISGIKYVNNFDISDTYTNVYEQMHCPDVLIHLAWGGLPNYDSCHHYEEELPKHYNFLKQVITDGLPNLFVTGTCYEYGKQYGALSEKIPTQPNTPYGFAKDTLRKQLEFLKKSTPFNLVWGRLFYTYGKGQSPSSIYSQYKMAVAKKDKFFNMSRGDQLNDYLPIKVATNYIIRLAIKKKDFGIVNICSGKPISIRALVETWIKDDQNSIQLKLGTISHRSFESMAYWGNSIYLQKSIS